MAEGKLSKVNKIIEGTWESAPHPSLVEPFWAACKAADALDRVKATEKLTKRNPGHLESHIAMAMSSLRAQLWGEARKHLENAIEASRASAPSPGVALGLPARICRMMAELEESENGDSGLAREWLMRASHAHDDPTWVCDDCGNAIGEWSAVCGKCENFDSFSWRTPPSIAGLSDERAGTAGLVALPPESAEAG